MNRSLTLLSLVGILFLGGCQDQSKLISDRYTHSINVYHLGTAAKAEEAMLSLVEFLNEKRISAPGSADYDDLLGIIWLRLYGLYQFQGDAQKASQAFSESMKYLHHRLSVSGDPRSREEQLHALLKGLEDEVPPRWKHSR